MMELIKAIKEIEKRAESRPEGFDHVFDQQPTM